MMISNRCQSLEDIDRLKLAIFQQDWWLTIARGSACLKEVQVHDANGVVVGRLVYIVQYGFLGIPLGSGPHLSRVSGPILGNNLRDEEKAIIINELIRKLPNISFTFTIAEDAPDAHLIRQAFKSAGFACFEQLNYSQPPEDVINRLGKKVREHIKQAHSKLDIINIDSNQFINFYLANLEIYDKKKCYFPLKVAEKIINISVRRDPAQARIIAASRKIPNGSAEQSVIDAAICIVWDDERCYYWLSTRRKESHPDAIKLLIVAAMKHASNLGLIFDADGVNTPGARRLFKTIFRMTTEEKRYIFTRTSTWSRLYEYCRYFGVPKLNKLQIGITTRWLWLL
jgi:hypothetical protein